MTVTCLFVKLETTAMCPPGLELEGLGKGVLDNRVPSGVCLLA